MTPYRFSDTLNFTLGKKKIMSRSRIVKLVYLKKKKKILESVRGKLKTKPEDDLLLGHHASRNIDVAY